MEQLAKEVAERITEAGDFDVDTIVEAENHASWGRIGLFDEDELLAHLEMRLSDAQEELEERIELRRSILESKIQNLNPEGLKVLRKHRHEVARHFKESSPEAYKRMMARRKEHIEQLEKTNPALAEKLKTLYEHENSEEE
jgi:hypothetical protein